MLLFQLNYIERPCSVSQNMLFFFSYLKSKRGQRQTCYLFPAVCCQNWECHEQVIRGCLKFWGCKTFRHKVTTLKFTWKSYDTCSILYSTLMMEKSHQELIKQGCFNTAYNIFQNRNEMLSPQFSPNHNGKSFQSKIYFPSLWVLKSFTNWQVQEAA